MRPRDRLTAVVVAVGFWSVVGHPAAAPAQLRGSGNEPVVTALDLYAARDGERAGGLNPGRTIRLAPRESIAIEADPIDQHGRRFPRDRFRMGAELGRNCRGVVSVSATSSGDLQFTAGRERGECRAVVWVAGNLNLEFQLEFEVTGLDTANYTRGQAAEIAERLYRAILQREIDAASRASAIAEVQRGRIQNQVESMLNGGEFARLRGAQQPAELLEAFYQGLLERAPDSAGARDYLNEILRGRYVPTIMNLVQSQEFEQAIVDAR